MEDYIMRHEFICAICEKEWYYTKEEMKTGQIGEDTKKCIYCDQEICESCFDGHKCTEIYYIKETNIYENI